MTNEPTPVEMVYQDHGRLHDEIMNADRAITVRVLKKLRHLATLDDPTAACKALTGPLGGLWRVRVGDWRVILDVQKNELVIIALELGHRSEVY